MHQCQLLFRQWCDDCYHGFRSQRQHWLYIKPECFLSDGADSRCGGISAGSWSGRCRVQEVGGSLSQQETQCSMCISHKSMNGQESCLIWLQTAKFCKILL